MLDATIHIIHVDDNFVLKQDSALVHIAHNTVQQQRTRRPTNVNNIDRLIYSSMNISCESRNLKKSSSNKLKSGKEACSM